MPESLFPFLFRFPHSPLHFFNRCHLLSLPIFSPKNPSLHHFTPSPPPPSHLSLPTTQTSPSPHVQRPPSLQSKLEGAVGKVSDGFVCVVHGQSDTSGSLEVEHAVLDWCATIFGGEADLEFAVAGDNEICGFVLRKDGRNTKQ